MRKQVFSCLLLTVLVCQHYRAANLTTQADAQARPRSAEEHAALRQRLQEHLKAWHASAKFPGATIGVALPDGSSFGLAVGYSDTTRKQLMTPDDLLLQGSVGKTYVAAVALQLVWEGKIGLDDKIEKWLGRERWFARLPNARDITVRMLMNHTSGLVRYEFKEQFTADLTRQPDKVWRPEELIAYILDTTAPFAAGKGWDYSDTNYIVLGMIIERATKSTYYRELSRRILKPLALRQTVAVEGRRIPKLSQGYAGTDNPFGKSDAMLVEGRMVINPQFEWTGGGIASTAADLARWAKLLYEGRAFNPSLLKEMLDGVPAKLGPEAKYGLGVIIRPTPHGLSYGHSGFFPGYLTEVMYFPQSRIAIAVQVNTSVPRATGKPLGRVITELAEVIINERTRADEATVLEAIKFDELEKVLQEELKQTRTPGAAIAIVSGERVIFAKGFGVSNVETGTPVTPDMLFRLGSTTKMFTGAALVTLASTGKINLDAPIGTYAVGLPPKLASLTAHQLISNTAGMADVQAPFVSHDDAALARMVRAWKDDALFTEPGEVYSYSSSGFWLAGYVLEEITKKPYADAMAELLFEPLGMKRTTLRPLLAMTYPLALGHSVQGSAPPAIIRPAFNNVAMWPAGSIFSSVNELSRFVIALLNNGRVDGKQVLSPSSVSKLMGRYAAMPGDANVHYGYGLLNFEDRGVRFVMHGGFSRGYGSMIQIAPEHRFAVIVQTNRSGETLPQTRTKAMELLLPLKAAAPEKEKKALPLSAAEANDFAGRYMNGPQSWEIINKEGKLYLKREGKELPLTRSDKYRLSFGSSLENDLVFVAGAGGKIKYLFDGLYSARKVS